VPTPIDPPGTAVNVTDSEVALLKAQNYTALEERVTALTREADQCASAPSAQDVARQEAQLRIFAQMLLSTPLIRNGTTTGRVTGRMSSGPWPFNNIARGPAQTLRGRIADTVIMDDLSDMTRMGRTTRIHDELPSPQRDNLVDAAIYARERAYPNTRLFRPGQPVATRALVPVSAPRQAQVERFSAVVLDQIDRPVHEALLAERRRMRTQWGDLMVRKAEHLYRTVQIPMHPAPIDEKRWRTLPEHPLLAETDRRLDMLIEDGVPYDDVRMFSLGHRLNVSTLPFVEHILVCYGLGSQEHFLVKATTINP
jgi:hypothetical protein